MRFPRITAVCACGLVNLLLLGCQDVEISRYTAPKPEKVDLRTAGTVPIRLLGAIFPRGQITWVFKLSGPEAQVVKQEEVFDKLVRSVEFSDQDPPITWTTPEGWKHEAGKGLRYATLRSGSGDEASEVTVSQLMGEKAASVEDNVGRWCDQLGLPKPTPAELTKYTSAIKVAGVEGTLVKITGSGSGKGPTMPPFVKGPGPEKGPAKPKLAFTKPEGWTEYIDTQGFSVASFKVGEGERAVVVTTTPLPGVAGGLLQNVNRWRQQINLPAGDGDQLRRDARDIKINGTAAHQVDLLGPRERIVGIVLPKGELTWFFKMRGPPDLVEKQLGNLSAFAESVKLD